jgi:argininosuccinate lyase
VLGVLKGLPLGYQRDLQEDKPPLFGAVATYEASLVIMAGLVATLAIDADRMRSAADEGYTTATAAADALVRRGVPFRVAHHVVGTLVGQAERDAIATLAELPEAAFVDALRGSDDPTARSLADEPRIAEFVRAAASVEDSLAAADVIGGTAPKRVAAALAAARSRLGRQRG